MALGVGKKASGMLAGLPEAEDPGPMTVQLAPGCPAAGVDGGSTWRRAAGAELNGQRLAKGAGQQPVVDVGSPRGWG